MDMTRHWAVPAAVTAAVVALIAGLYLAYETAWGTPFRIRDLLMRQAIQQVLDSPQAMTQVGIIDGEWYDFSSDELDRYSLKERRRIFDRTRRHDAELAAWETIPMSEQNRLSLDIVRWTYARTLADEKYPWLGANNRLYPVEQAFGIQKGLPNFLLSIHRITNERMARHYLARLEALSDAMDTVRLDIARQADEGVIAPDFIIDDSIAQMRTFIAPVPGENPLVTHLAERTEAIGMDGADRNALINEAVAIMADAVYPAYRRLIAEEEALRKRASHDAGLWRLKDGAAYYADQLKTLTTTDMTPDEIHAYGLAEVARLTAEMDAVLKSAGLTEGTVGARMIALMADRRFLYPNSDTGRAAMLARYGQILGRMKWMLPRYFPRIPMVALEVRRVPVFAEKGSSGAYYERPSLDGARPGVFFANLRNTAEVPMWAMPTLAYHEGVPGHHLQIATATEIEDLPFQRRLAYFPAFGEGWAMYAEQLAKEMGLYANDPYGDLGRLQSELFRAARLVVDTGIHAKHWSREKAIAYMQATTGMANSDVTAEVERYVVWPGQACAYKIGMKAILGLREQARRELGARFDLKEFHAVILENGAMPLWLAQRNVDRWIAGKIGTSANAADSRYPYGR
jgi:uncharacterized protein (DUF885 family)